MSSPPVSAGKEGESPLAVDFSEKEITLKKRVRDLGFLGFFWDFLGFF